MPTEIAFRRVQKDLLAFESPLSREEKIWLEKVSFRLHPHDDMYDKSMLRSEYATAKLYLLVGLSACCCIDKALGQSRKNAAVQSILDFPCGYGRVLRFLEVRFPNAEIVAGDINPIALEFCKRAFSVKTVTSNESFSKVSLPRQFDLIWSGSLATHLDEKRMFDLLRFLYEHLAPGGLCLFTSHGRTSVEWIQDGKWTYGLSASAQRKLLSGFHEHGYGYVDYESTVGYGISVVSYDRMVEAARRIGQWTESVFLEHGWANQHDVYGFTKSDIGSSADGNHVSYGI